MSIIEKLGEKRKVDIKVFEFEGIKYVIRYPNCYVEGEKYPTILHLHGAGTRGDNIDDVLGGAFFRFTDDKEDFPFVTVAPQCNANSWFDIFEKLIKLAKNIVTESFCDPERYYLIGLSMGGYAAWQLGMSCPELFAAMIPICGGGMAWNAARLKSVPVWAFHGALDPTVSPEETRLMVNGVNQCGGRARFTLYPDAYHDAWSPTYCNPEVFDWLLSNKKKTAAKHSDGFNDSERFG